MKTIDIIYETNLRRTLKVGEQKEDQLVPRNHSVINSQVFFFFFGLISRDLMVKVLKV